MESLDEILARLTAVIGDIEAGCMTSGAPIALARNRGALYAAMDALGGWMVGFLAARPSAAEIQASKARITGLIRPWSRTGPFFDRCYGKRRGHPGDFETLEILYNGRPGGADLRAHIFDDYYLHTIVARAVRNRLAHLVGWLGEEVQGRVVGGVIPVRVLSLGSGPARELRILADDPVFSEAVAVTCLDPDAEALRYVRNRLRNHLDGRVTYLRADPLRFARGPGRPSRPYHIIYAAGLFDYLGADQVGGLVEDCYSLLAPGGRLLVSNLSTGLPANERILFEWLLEWHPLYRGQEDYRRILAGTSFGMDRVRFVHEPLAGALFVVAERFV